MDLSFPLHGALSTAPEQSGLPFDSSVAVDDLPPLLYLPQPELELPLPVPVVVPDSVASAEPPQDQDHDVAEPGVDASLESVDPQQWLNMMLGQQAIRLQARDDAGRATSGLPGGRLLARMAPEFQDLAPTLDLRKVAEAPLPAQPGTEGEAERSGLSFGSRLQEWAAPAASKGENPAATPPATPTTVATTVAAVAGSVEPLANTGVSAPTAALAGSSTTAEPVLERGLKLAAPQARWGEQMLHALRETVEVQVQQRFQQATIRLDPPELGSLEIFISHESGRLSVHISAAQTDVARLIASTSERLRQELVEQNTLQVQVQVSSDSQGHSQREQGRSEREPVIVGAMEDAEGSTALPKHKDSGVLVTV